MSGSEQVRFIPAALAKAMVDGGSAAVANANGRVKASFFRRT
jgi:hypothetical protein